MLSPTQLEIIDPKGEVAFYELDPVQEVTNIGRHPENDIVIDSPGIAPFHMMLVHRQWPYHLMVLSQEGQTSLGGRPVVANVSQEMQTWDTIEFDGYTIILLEGGSTVVGRGAETSVSTPPRPVSPASFSATVPMPRPAASTQTFVPPAIAPMPQPATLAPTAPPAPHPAPAEVAASTQPLPAPSQAEMAPVGLAARPGDLDDDVIHVEISECEWAIDVDQVATCDVIITNAGDVVATFEVWVSGLDLNWVAISAQQINLNEGEKQTITLNITPPRHPSSRAGVHHFAIVVTSSTHPDRFTQKGATLVINPYYEFAVGELSPKQQTISYGRRSGQVVLPIANKGNSETLFRIEAQDDERACTFEFEMPGETTRLARQVELPLPPEETFAVPLYITPQSRQLVSMRQRNYSFTVTAGMVEGSQTSRSVMGKLTSKPRFGRFSVIFTALVLLMSCMLGCVLVGRPTVETFEASPQIVEAGTPIALSYKVSWNLADADIEGTGVGEVGGRSGQITVLPKEDTTYKIEADNLLSRLLPFVPGDSKEVQVIVTPVYPEIRFFEISNDQGVLGEGDSVILGESIDLRWKVINADRVVFNINGAPQELLPEEYEDQRTTQPEAEGPITYMLQAYNYYTGESSPRVESKTVNVYRPTATPVPPPVIDSFTVDKNRIVLGDEVVFSWVVSGDPDQVEITSVGQVEPVGALPYAPPAVGTINFWLVAVKAGVENPPRRSVVVVVDKAPDEPEIKDFYVQPSEYMRGDESTTIRLYWSVGGDVRDIEISGPDFGPFSGLEKEDSMQVPKGSLPLPSSLPERTIFFTIKATGVGEDQGASSKVALTIIEPPTPTPTFTPAPPTPTHTPTSTPWPLPVILYFRAENMEADPQPDDVTFVMGSNPPTYRVRVGTLIRLAWEVQGAVQVHLEGSGDQPLVGNTERFRLYAAEAGQYHLWAENDMGDRVNAFLIVELNSPEPPPPPENFIGVVDASAGITLTWSYPSQYVGDIVGFRIYRAAVPPGNDFQLINEALDPLLREWIDDTLPTCGKTYRIMALYPDPTDPGGSRLLETINTEWGVGACLPTPTPAPN